MYEVGQLTLPYNATQIGRGGVLPQSHFRHSVDWWGLPTRLEWALALVLGAGGYQTGSLAAHIASEHLSEALG